MKKYLHDNIVGVLLQTRFCEGLNVAVDKIHIGLLEAKLLRVIVHMFISDFQL